MPADDDSALQQPLQTFFRTRQTTSSSITALPLPAITFVFNRGLDNIIEAFMRLGVAGLVPDTDAVEEAGYVGQMFGFHRRVRWIETDQGPAPGPPIPPREIQQPPLRRRYTLVKRVASQHANAVPYYNIAPTIED